MFKIQIIYLLTNLAYSTKVTFLSCLFEGERKPDRSIECCPTNLNSAHPNYVDKNGSTKIPNKANFFRFQCDPLGTRR